MVFNKEQPTQKLSDYESVRLFDERARLVQMDFTLTKENASSVAQICNRLDGIPLAIELAAVRVQTFSPEQIASQLNECFHALTDGIRTALPRHQTLDASIGWSWNLLYDPEQILLRRLSVFSGGFSLEAAGQVCVGEGIESRQITGVISQLVMKALVVVNQNTGRERRYRLLETICQYAREKLMVAGEQEKIWTRHLKYFLQLSEQAEPALKGPTQIEWHARLIDERDNIRAALESAVHMDVEAGLYISGRLERFWEDFDLREGAGWLSRFLELPESHIHPHARAKALYAYGMILYPMGHTPQLEVIAEECLRLYRLYGDQHGEIDGLFLLGRFIFASNNMTRTRELNQQTLNLSESLGDLWRKAVSLGHLGWTGINYQQKVSYWTEAVKLFREVGDLRLLEDYLSTLGHYEVLNGDFETAQRNLEEAIQLNQKSNHKGGVHFIHATLSRIEMIKGNFERARAVLEEDIVIAKELGNHVNYLWDRATLVYVVLRQGKTTQARDIFAETAREFLKDRNEIGVVFTLEGMAGLFVETKKPKISAQLIGWADTRRKNLSDMRPPIEQVDVDKIIAACIAKMGEVAFSDAYDEGEKMTLDKVVAYALQN